MKTVLYIFFFVSLLFSSVSTTAQNMDNEKLGKIIYVMADSIQGTNGNWQFMIKDRLLLCVTDSDNNRMRIMSPIIEKDKLLFNDLSVLMEANFHTALDVKYAISNELLWSVFIHPLRELNKEQVIDAIKQVYSAAYTYGDSYSSTGLIFPNKLKEKEKKIRKL